MGNTNAKKKKVAAGRAAVLEKPKRKKKPGKTKRRRGLTNAELRELMKANKPPQSWYDEDQEGLY
jgi:hypothetical protein